MTATPTSTSTLHEYEIAKRPPRTWQQIAHAILSTIVFIFGCCVINATQFLFLPLRFLPYPRTRALYDDGLRYTKGAFGILLVLVSQLFAPTTLKITFSQTGPGAFSEEEIQRTIVKDASGRPVALNVPENLVLMANHQMYADWWYLWCLTYFMGMHKDVYITLKKSLKWVPLLGWGMQFFDFIFLARSWASDRHYLASRLAAVARHAQSGNNPLAFMFFPEGTLVSKDTRPLSKKYADKMGIEDTSHVLLPRSTGLHYVLRSLGPRLPALHILDVTLAYPGIPRLAYGQSYYTLRSIFMDGIPPPVVHLHLRLFNVSESVPIGDMSKTKSTDLLSTINDITDTSTEVEVPEHDRIVFDEWLLALWREKDRNMEQYLSTGSFSPTQSNTFDFPLKLQKTREILDAFCFFWPALTFYALSGTGKTPHLANK